MKFAATYAGPFNKFYFWPRVERHTHGSTYWRKRDLYVWWLLWQFHWNWPWEKLP